MYWIGLDSGSVSLKSVIINEGGEVIKSSYVKNFNLITSLKETLKLIKMDGEIKGIGITGTGQNFISKIIGGDIREPETVAHYEATIKQFPKVRTIMDIGGQDSKILIIDEKGLLRNITFNKMCLIENTSITSDGFIQKPIQEIKIGDKVLTHNGIFDKVIDVYKRKYCGEIIDIKVSNLRKLEITPEHPILALKRKDIRCYNSNSRSNIAICRPYKSNSDWCKKNRCKKGKTISFAPRFIEAKKLEKGDLIAIPLPSDIKNTSYLDYNKVKKINQRKQRLKEINRFNFKSDLLRLIGYYLAEGNLLYFYYKNKIGIKKRSCLGIQFTFNINERNYINDVVNILNSNFDVSINIRHKPERKTTNIMVYNKSLAMIIKYLCKEKSNNKVMSNELMFLSPELQLEILKGVFRGDGCFKNKKICKRYSRSFCLTTISKQLAYQIQWLLLRNKIKCGFYKDKEKTKGGHIAYNIEICGLEINKLKDDLFYINENEIKKNHSYSFIYSNWLLVPIKTIKSYDYEGYVYNLKIESDNSYIANSLSVHNCGGGTGAFIELIADELNVKVNDVGDLGLKSKNDFPFAGKCGVFARTSVVDRKNKGVSKEDILWGVCKALVGNYFAILGKGKNLFPEFVFQGATAKNKALVKCMEDELQHKVSVPKHPELMGALGIALITQKDFKGKTNFKGFQLADADLQTKTFICDGCVKNCEVTQLFEDGRFIGGIGTICGKWEKMEHV